jgi:FkbH-like protein
LLACGFTPLHLQTFLAAHLQQAISDRKVAVKTGLFGNVIGTIESAVTSNEKAIAIALEWPDLDPRLGFRQTGGWSREQLSDILLGVRQSLDRCKAALAHLPAAMPFGISLPTLPPAPVFAAPQWLYSPAESELQAAAAEFACAVLTMPNASIVNRGWLDERSPLAQRFDLKSELLAGLPYSLPHADAVGQALAQLLGPRLPKKGLITDLDDTFWKGIVGDAGPDGVSWDLASHSQIHGLYQQMLRALADEGVLIGIASKNDPAAVKQAFARPDVLMPLDRAFPVEVHWNAKSGSVERILRTWNILADSVVFVDDSPMELAEVGAAHPGMECMLFPKSDYAEAYAFLRRLRDRFGKARVSDEDRLRLQSIRQNAEFQQVVEQGGAAPEAFLEQLNAIVTLDFRLPSTDPRVLELVDKTNQFNLNGIRFSEADWQTALEQPGAFLVAVSYEDKFGQLGKIAVLQGRQRDRTLLINAWVMSCRAFARRIEHQCLRTLFERFDAQEMEFAWQPTPKNGPASDFLNGLTGTQPSQTVKLSRTCFTAQCPALYHTVRSTP